MKDLEKGMEGTTLWMDNVTESSSVLMISTAVMSQVDLPTLKILSLFKKLSLHNQVSQEDWVGLYNDLQSVLVCSCDVLVNPDNTLTTKGERWGEYDIKSTTN
jgi:hypothetical protein